MTQSSTMRAPKTSKMKTTKYLQDFMNMLSLSWKLWYDVKH